MGKIKLRQSLKIFDFVTYEVSSDRYNEYNNNSYYFNYSSKNSFLKIRKGSGIVIGIEHVIPSKEVIPKERVYIYNENKKTIISVFYSDLKVIEKNLRTCSEFICDNCIFSGMCDRTNSDKCPIITNFYFKIGGESFKVHKVGDELLYKGNNYYIHGIYTKSFLDIFYLLFNKGMINLSRMIGVYINLYDTDLGDYLEEKIKEDINKISDEYVRYLIRYDKFPLKFNLDGYDRYTILSSEEIEKDGFISIKSEDIYKKDIIDKVDYCNFCVYKKHSKICSKCKVY